MPLLIIYFSKNYLFIGFSMDVSELNKISLLYVEDDEDIRSELVEVLELYIGELYVAEDGKEGLELFHKYKPDIIVSDIQMSVMDGLEMCEHIRDVDKDVPIIITTAFNDPSFLMRSIDIGVDKYITKPISINKLEEVLLRCSKFVYQNRMVNDLLKLSKQLMDKNDNLMYITGDDFSHINKSLLNFLDFGTTEEFFKNHNTIFDKLNSLSLDEIAKSKKEWVEYIKNNSTQDHVVYLKECVNENRITPYKIHVEYLNEIEHYLISLHEIKESF